MADMGAGLCGSCSAVFHELYRPEKLGGVLRYVLEAIVGFSGWARRRHADEIMAFANPASWCGRFGEEGGYLFGLK